MKIFVSGSRTCTIDNTVISILKNWMNKEYEFLVGDCKGIDTEVQNFLADNNYRKVSVYHSSPRFAEVSCRNLNEKADVLGWNIISARTDETPFTKGFFTAKDIAMTEECDLTFVVWDGMSLGSKANIKRALKLKKDVVFKIGNKVKVYKRI